MADALISPAVGGTMWAASAGLAVYSATKLKSEMTERKVPLMGVMGAFVFAAQMINFSIPGTGSSGHLAGGLLLAGLLGPYAAFLVMLSILTVQALFFGDGGLLALGCNVFNMGFWACFVVYPLLFRRITGDRPSWSRLLTAAITSAIIALQFGAFSVVLETRLSGISALTFEKFVLLMQPIHLAIGTVEGLVTAALLSFVWRARPEILDFAKAEVENGESGVERRAPTKGDTMRHRIPFSAVLIVFAAAAVLTGGVLSWFASTQPDGLEWATFRTTGKQELAPPPDGVHRSLADVQRRTAFLPDYDFAGPAETTREATSGAAETEGDTMRHRIPFSAAKGGTSLAGLLGSAIVLGLAGLIGLMARLGRRRNGRNGEG